MKHIFFLLFLALSMSVNGQVSINTDGALPDNSAMLDVKSTTKGILLPRMTLALRNAILSPATGLMIWQTDNTPGFYYNSGTTASPVWVIAGTGSGWGLTGNNGTSAATNFIGTTDAQPLRFRVNNGWAGEIHPVSGNLFLGLGAGQAITSGQSNAAFGRNALFANTTGSFNTSIGADALITNTTGSSNIATGYQALYSNTSGGQNTAIGKSALYSNTTGFSNTANGFQALYSNTTGYSNAAFGGNALINNTTGFNNTTTGDHGLYYNSTGYNNTATGFQALYSNATGSTNSATGAQALASNTTGDNNTANGYQSLYFNTTAGQNTATGYQALYSNTTGNVNTATGIHSLYSNTTGENNTATGSFALASNTTGFNNTANGFNTLASNSVGNNNTANGSNAFLYNTTGFNNTGSGFNVLYSNTTGYSNTAFGLQGLYNNTTGYQNVAIGYNVLVNNIGGNNNIAIGSNSGTASYAPNIYNTISIGNDGLLNGYQNQVIIGNSSTGYIGGVVSWSVVSDARIKNTIMEDVKGLDFITRLHPVTYHRSIKAMTEITGNKETADYSGKYEIEKVKYSGFLAQEVEQAAKESGYDFSGVNIPKNNKDLYSLSYEQFVVPLVKGMQEQQKMIEAQIVSNEELKAAIEELKAQNAQLKQMIGDIVNK